MSLHHVQEQALLKAVTTAAQAEMGMPSVYSCIHAACAFLENGGLAQAGISLLSDDCLATILSFLATSREIIHDIICVALPIFEAASKTNVVWKQLCRRRWGEKWGFQKRWRRALSNSDGQSNQHFWMQAYNEEEEDAKRNLLTRDELTSMTFDYRQWFSFTLFHNQPDNMRDVLPTGLRESIARDVVFTETGAVHSSRDWLSRLHWKVYNDGAIGRLWLTLASSNSRRPVESLTVHRLRNWGWELRGSDYVLRPMDEEDVSKLWEDLSTNIIVEEKLEWVIPHRGAYPYQYREIPDDEDYKGLDW